MHTRPIRPHPPVALTLTLLTLLLVPPAPLPAVVLVNNHQPAALLALPAQPDAHETLAARELTPAGTDYAARVKVIGQTLAMLNAFNTMLDARTRVDFPTAKTELDKLDAIATELMEIKPVAMVSAGRFSTYLNYMKRFYRPCTEQGFQRVTNGNQLVAAAPDEWQFQIDPVKIGEDIGLWRAETTGGNWQKLKTSSTSWSNQGLRYYKGLAWYRTTLEIPAKHAGQRLFLWCGGVDEAAKIWLNGQHLGNSPGAAFYPFEMDATAAAKPGPNTLVICVSNQIVNELGTGGLVAPVLLYAPAAGQDAKLENVRDLKPTFP